MSIDATANVIWCEVTIRQFKTGELRTISGVLLEAGSLGFYLARDAEDMRGSNTYLIPNINQHQGITKAHGRFNGTELPLYLNEAAAIEPLQPTLPEYVMKRLSRRGILYNNNLKTLQ